MICGYAKLDQDKINALQGMEKDMGTILLAFSCQAIKPAELTSEQLERIKEVEEELGVVIVAV